MNNTLSDSFSESIMSKTNDAVLDTAEIIFDSFLDDGLFKEIPIVKYVAATYHIIDDIRGKVYLKKLCQFVDEFNRGVTSEADIVKYRERIEEDNRNRELEYILCIIDKYLDIEKPRMLAKLYLAYLDRKITWDDFCVYSEVLDHIYRNDIQQLMNAAQIKVHNNQVPASLLRLTGVGLMLGYQNNLAFEDDGAGGIAVTENTFEKIKTKERLYTRTEFGEKFVEIIS